MPQKSERILGDLVNDRNQESSGNIAC